MKYLLSASVILPALCTGCMAPQKELAHHSSLPQLIRFVRVSKVQMKPGALFITGKGSAAADGGKYDFTSRSPVSSYPLIEMTIRSDKSDVLNSCMRQAQAAKDNRQSIDIRGMGTFAIQSMIDPPLDTGVFTLTQPDACGAAVFSTVSTIAASTPTVSAADLVAVPERYLDRKTLITGRLASPVQFMDPVSRLMIESEGESLSGYFPTQSLSAESRLALVHAAPGSLLILEGTLTRKTSPTGYEFDVSNVVSVTTPAQ